MNRPDGSTTSLPRFFAILIAPMLIIGGCSGSGGDAPVTALPPTAESTPKVPPAPPGQPGSADYSGKGVASGVGR